MSKRLTLFIAATTFIFIGAGIVSAKTIKYVEKIGDVSNELTWQVAEGNGKTSLTVSEKNFTYTSNYDKDLAVIKWAYEKGENNTAINAVRKNNLIKVTGDFNGEKINKTLKVNRAPWYQPLSFSLGPFIKSDKKVIIYWTINPRNASVYRMKAQKASQETLLTKIGKIPAQKVKVSLAGPKAMFWSSYYWFRLDDGQFIQYKGVDGPPGTPQTVTTIISEKN